MGRDKAFLQLRDETLLAHALKLWAAITKEVKIVGDATKFSAFGRVVEDVYPNRGPLGGIHAALSTSSTDLNLMLAVDLPFVGADFLQYLLTRARESTAIVTLPREIGGLQPLCAVYRRPFAEIRS